VTKTALTFLPLLDFSCPRIRSLRAPTPKTPKEHPIPATLSVETSALIPNSLTSMDDSEGVAAKIDELVTRRSTSSGRKPD